MRSKPAITGKILIAEDQPLYYDALEIILKQIFNDIDIVEVGSHNEVLQAVVDDNSFDLILLDISLHESGDYSCLEKLRLVTATTPIVIISATENPATISEAFRYGATGYLPKSSPKEVMVNAFKLIMSGGVFIPATAIALHRLSKQDSVKGLSTGQSRDLTYRQQVVLGLMSKGKANKEIAHELDISESTVKVHVSAILKKLGANNRVQAALMAGDILV